MLTCCDCSQRQSSLNVLSQAGNMQRTSGHHTSRRSWCCHMCRSSHPPSAPWALEARPSRLLQVGPDRHRQAQARGRGRGRERPGHSSGRRHTAGPDTQPVVLPRPGRDHTRPQPLHRGPACVVTLLQTYTQCVRGQNVFLHRNSSRLLYAFITAASGQDVAGQDERERMLTYAGACAGGGA